MTTIPIPAAAIEAAAKAIYHDVANGNPATDFPGYDSDELDVRNHCLDMATNVLAAVFGVGEIRQQWRPAWEYRPTTTGDRWLFGSVTTWTEDRAQAEEHARSVPVETKWSDGYPIYRNAHVQSRYVLSVSGEDGWEITTAWRNVDGE